MGSARAAQRVQYHTQKNLQPGEDEAEVVADGGEDGVACGSLETAAAEMAVGLHVADHGLDCEAAAQLAFDGAEHASLLGLI